MVLRDHVYDGIQEYDQKLPNWWLFTLYIMIVWFVVYWVMYYQLGWFKSDEERIDAQMALVNQERDRLIEEMMADLDNSNIWEMSRDPSHVAAGKEIFAGKCANCHGADLSGFNPEGVKLPGLPLNDTEWKHGGEPMDAFHIIMNGSPRIETGMVPWKTMLSAADIVKVTAYVMSYHEEGAEWTRAPDAPAPAAPDAPGL